MYYSLLLIWLTDCTIRYEQEFTEWEQAVKGVAQDCDQQLKLVCDILYKINI